MQDILIYDNGNGSDMSLTANDLMTVDGLTNQVYLALFGGGGADWFGNAEDIDIGINSIFESELKNVALNTAGLRRLENAAKVDLSYFDNVNVECSLLAPNKLQISVVISENLFTFVWSENNIETII